MVHPDFNITPEVNPCFDDEISELIEKVDDLELLTWIDSVINQLNEDVLEIPEMDIDDLLSRSEVI